jgi:hypothetical protein
MKIPKGAQETSGAPKFAVGGSNNHTNYDLFVTAIFMTARTNITGNTKKGANK